MKTTLCVQPEFSSENNGKKKDLPAPPPKHATTRVSLTSALVKSTPHTHPFLDGSRAGPLLRWKSDPGPEGWLGRPVFGWWR